MPRKISDAQTIRVLRIARDTAQARFRHMESKVESLDSEVARLKGQLLLATEKVKHLESENQLLRELAEARKVPR